MTTSFGARLRAARERHGISLVAIAEQTKIKLSLLEELERDDVSHWPGGIFRRSWVRAYAQRIGLDPESTVRQFVALYPEDEETPEMLAAARTGQEQRAPTRLRFLLGSALGALAGRRAGTGSGATSSGPLETPASTVAEAPARADDQPGAVPQVSPVEFSLTPPPDDIGLDSARTASMTSLSLDLPALAALCLRLSCATDLGQVAPVLDAARGLLRASGIVLWVRLAQEHCVAAVLTSGYPADLLAQLPRVPEQGDIPVARAVVTGELQVVGGDAESTSALAMPLLQPSGPVGVLALELPAGLERDPHVHAGTRILAAQLASLLAG